MKECRDIGIAEAAARLKSADRILILSHMKPDGDTLGSGFALLYSLLRLGKTARIECADGFPARYRFLYQDFDVNAQPDFEPELVVAVDIADTQLFGDAAAHWVDRVALCIDHHPSNSRYADELLLDTNAAATAEIVAEVLESLGVTPDKQTAVCIYTGITTDTGCFRYSNTTSATHRLAARMIDLGVKHYTIDKLMFETKSVARMELERMVMDTLEYYYGNRFAVIVITDEAVAQTHVPEEDLEGIAAVPRQIEGVEVSATLRQKGGDRYRVSLRTCSRINASAVCAKLGGGGHARAAGCVLECPLEEAKLRLISALAAEF